LVTSVYGAEFATAAGLVRWLALTLLVVPLGTLCTALWTGTGRLRPVLVAGSAAAAVDLGLAWALVPPLAATGAVIATVSAQCTLALLIVGHTYRSGLRLDLRLRRIAWNGLVALTAAAVTIGVDAVTDGWVAVGATILAFCLTTVAGVRLLGLLDRDDVDWLAHTLPERAGRLLSTLSPHR
jgi:O-antigen/teichoic acid export membrane protein